MNRLVVLRILVVSFLCAASLSGCREKIVHNLSERDANRVLSALSKEDIVAEKQSEGATWSIAVDSDKMVRALEVLDGSRILGRMVESSQRSSGFVQTREESQWQVEREVASSLEKTFERLPGVLESRVHLYMFSDNRIEIRSSAESKSGSVLLVVDSSYAVTEDQVKSIVSGASGISSKLISVVVTLGTINSKVGGTAVASGRHKQNADLDVNGGSQLGIPFADVRLISIAGMLIGLGLIGVVSMRGRAKKVVGTGRPQSILMPRVSAPYGEPSSELDESAILQ